MSFNKLAMIMSSSVIDGSAAVVAASGFFIPANIPTVAFAMMAGPSSLATAASLRGDLSERFIVALIAGVLATLAVIGAAMFGPLLLQFLNFKLFQIFAGISVMFIALLIMGVRIPSLLPLLILILGIAASILWR